MVRKFSLSVKAISKLSVKFIGFIAKPSDRVVGESVVT